ncbi:MAG: hypothetical protein O3B73_02715 [bacterium]|nr:hypothetical protein [bacterium]
MFSTLFLAGILILVVALKYLVKPAQRCPECHTARQQDFPICECGYVFEFPDEDDDPLEYGDPDDAP